MSCACPKCGKEFPGRSIGTHGIKCGVTFDMLFWQKVDKSAGPDACWPYTGARTSWNYGHFNSKANGEFMAHRLAWELANGRKPTPGVMNGTIRHTCDNPPCCNPKHLILGTHIENMADCRAKDRHVRGERTRRNKLTEADVLAIRDGWTPEKAPDLAQKYGVKPLTILNAALGRTWSYLK